MARDIVTFTVPEAGYVLGQSSKAVNKAIDDGEILVSRAGRKGDPSSAKVVSVSKQGHASVLREIGQVELRYLALLGKAPHFNPQGRREIYQRMRRLPADAAEVQLGPVTLKFEEVDRAIAPRVSRILQLRKAVEKRAGTLVIKGTEVPVYAIAALKDLSVESIAKAYPSLSREQIEMAKDYAKVHPKAGRPYPTTTMKDRIAELASAGIFDDVEDLEPASLDDFRKTFG